MIWLVTQVWAWMLLCAALGAAVTVVAMVRLVPVERWVEVRLDGPERADQAARSAPRDVVAAVAAAVGALPPEGQGEEADAAATGSAGRTGSPFPALPGHDASYRPWEAEELWSRPATPVRGDGTPRPADAWAEAAESWRSWADQAVARVESTSGADDDDDLFAADREAERLGLEAGVFSTSLEHLLAARGSVVEDDRDEDPFPYARPVEAPVADGDAFPGVLPPDRLSA